MSRIENIWQASPEHVELQWVSAWVAPNTVARPPVWPFTVSEVVERLNEWLDCLNADFVFAPDPLLSSDHYAWMKMRDHTQAIAVSLLGQMAAQTLLDERKG